MSRSLSPTIFLILLSCAFAFTTVAGQACSGIRNCDDCARWTNCVWCEDFDTCQYTATYSCRRPDFSVSSCPSNRSAVGAIVGAVLGSFFFVMCIIAFVFFCRRRRYYYAQQQSVILTPAYPTPATVVYTGSPVQQQPPMGQPMVYNAQGQPMSPQYGQPQQQPNYGAPVYGAQPTYAQSPQPFVGQPHQMGQPPVYSPPQQQQPPPPQQQQQPFVGQPHQMGQQPYAQQPYAQQTQPGY